MLPETKSAKLVAKGSLCRRSTWARAPQSGILRATEKLGARVEKGRVLGRIGDPFGDNEVPVLAPASGIVIGQSMSPLANVGEALFHIALFDAPEEVAERIQMLRQDFDEEPDS